jgi:uncharacterized protein (TIGR02757 family)
MSPETRRLLLEYADRYEVASFLQDDPSFFLRCVDGDLNREATAFVASSLSFGSRPQFMAKVREIIALADRDVDGWIRKGAFGRDFRADDRTCFYRFFTRGNMHRFFAAYRRMMDKYGSLGEYVRATAGGDAVWAVSAICRWFSENDGGGLVPQDAKSACKRVCMFLRWMVRSGSPVDLGLWAGFMDRRTLVVPLDTHVVQEAMSLGLLKSPCASMCAARRLTAAMSEVFPDDPSRGDFALFGYGVDKSRQEDPK